MPDESGPTGPILSVMAVVAAALGAYFYAPTFVLGTACGILAVLAAECAVVLYLYSVLVNKTSESLASTAGTPEERRADTEGIPWDAIGVAEGVMWVAVDSPTNKNPANANSLSHSGSGPKEDKLSRVQKYEEPQKRMGRLEGGVLVVRGVRGSGEEDHIPILGCDVKVISGTGGPNRKWSNKYPLQLIHPSLPIWKGLPKCVLYLPSGPLKESWSVLLRASAQGGGAQDPDTWHGALRKEYHTYLAAIRSVYPFWHEGGGGSGGEVGGEVEVVEEKSKASGARKWLSRFAKQGEEDTRARAALRVNRLFKRNRMNTSPLRQGDKTPPQAWAGGSSRGGDPKLSDMEMMGDGEEGKKGEGDDEGQGAGEGEDLTDGGTRAVNAFLARAFFDVQRSARVNGVLQKKIQTKLERIRTPSYMGAISCTHFHIGTCPPLFRTLEVVSTSDGATALEGYVECYGGAKLTIETRVDMREVKGAMGVGPEGGEGGVTEDGELRDPVLAAEGEGSGKGGGQARAGIFSRGLKAVMSHVAAQVSPLRLTLSISVPAVKGTLRFRLPAPPSDRLWLGFVDRPEVVVLSEPSIGEMKIPHNPIATWLLERIKRVILESLTLPQSTDVRMAFMTADEGDLQTQEEPPASWAPQPSTGRAPTLAQSFTVDSVTADESDVLPPVATVHVRAQSEVEPWPGGASFLPAVVDISGSGQPLVFVRSKSEPGLLAVAGKEGPVGSTTGREEGEERLEGGRGVRKADVPNERAPLPAPGGSVRGKRGTPVSTPRLETESGAVFDLGPPPDSGSHPDPPPIAMRERSSSAGVARGQPKGEDDVVRATMEDSSLPSPQGSGGVMGLGRLVGSILMERLRDKEKRDAIEAQAKRALGFLRRGGGNMRERE